jgi:uncharacterized protein (DUF362 family)
MGSTVSLMRYDRSPDSLREAIESCNGFDGLSPEAAVLIKPNLVRWSRRFTIAPYGVVTTTRMVEDLIILLKERGCSSISIGEGSVYMEPGVGTDAAFEGLGYIQLAERYGISLIDFNRSEGVPFKVPAPGNITLRIAREALEADFLINVPVLKTHGQTKISLGMKNLKGCLKASSKKMCHRPDGRLEYCFSFLADMVKPALTVIDGIYALERGAMHYGRAYRTDMLIASRDILAADMVGAKIIGYEPGEIEHFREYAARHDRPLTVDDVDVRGGRVADHITPLAWDWDWKEDNTGPPLFDKLGIQGVAVPKYDETLCSGCSPLANLVNILVISAFSGSSSTTSPPDKRVEILNGKRMQARPGYEYTVLMGNCIIKANEGSPHIRNAVPVAGCPPRTEDVVAALKGVGLDVDEKAYDAYMERQGNKYNGKEGYSPELYRPA